MDSDEFAEWLAYHQMFPIGENSDDIRAGSIASAIVNIHRKKGSKPRTWADFFPPYAARKPRSDWRGLLAKVTAINTQLGGDDKRRNKTPTDS